MIVLPHGNQTKPALLTTEGAAAATRIDLTALRGIIEYDPDEFVFSALAGTPLEDIIKALSEHGQFLPFDPELSTNFAPMMKSRTPP
jgi:glycolate oxidase FAD binding subunit